MGMLFVAYRALSTLGTESRRHRATVARDLYKANQIVQNRLFVNYFTCLTMQLCREIHRGTPLPHSTAARHSRCSPGPVRRPRRVVTRYQDNDASHVSLDDVSSAPRTSQVSAEDTYAAAVANMPEGAWAGRWERWAPPAEGFRGGLFRPDDTDSGWQLLTSGAFVRQRGISRDLQMLDYTG